MKKFLAKKNKNGYISFHQEDKRRLKKMSKSFDFDVDFISDCAQVMHDYLLDKGDFRLSGRKDRLTCPR